MGAKKLNNFIPKTIKKWELPSSYFGKTWYEYYEIIGQHRDSEILDRSNFESMLKKLGGGSNTVIVNHCSHWAVGWVETIMIHESDIEKLKIADELMTKYNNYPVIDEDHYIDLQHESYSKYAESEKCYLADFLEEVFTIPKSWRDETENLAYYLNLITQEENGEFSCFDHNIYRFRNNLDFNTKQLENLINNSNFYNCENVNNYIKACLGME